MLLQKDLSLFRKKSLLLAVSGGVDSVCLLHYFYFNQKALDIKLLHVCHVNHGVRGSDSDADSNLVVKLCLSYGLPLDIKNLDPAAFNKKESFESEARNLRYEILSKIQKEQNLDYILTAHHADDQAETLYMRLRRGTSLKGLQGVLAEREDQVVRPFLNASKETLLQYAKKHHLEWREDLSNQNINFARNKVRNVILPYLEEHSTGTAATLSNIASLSHRTFPKIIDSASHFLKKIEIPDDEWPFPRKYSPYPKVWCCSTKAIEKAVKQMGNGFIEILRLWLNDFGFYYTMEGFQVFISSSEQSRYSYREDHIEKSKHFMWFYSTTSPQKLDNLYLFQENKRFSGEWRYRREGDRFTPPGSQYKKRKLKKWLQEKGIPLWIRDFLPLLTQDADVLWIPGVAISGKLNSLQGRHDESKNSFSFPK